MKKVKSFILPLALVSLLVGCGGNGGSESSKDTSSASQGSESQSESTSESTSKSTEESSEDSSQEERHYEPIHSDTLYTKKVENMTDDFIIGMDASSVIAEEASGVKYYDFDGQEKDVFEILSNNGVNYIRVRIWNNPFDSEGHGFGGGNNDLATAIKIGKRATANNMKLLVDFHYSDFWADPAKQQAPRAWVDMDILDKMDALYAFTKESLQAMKDEGIDVGMVQVGNETSAGRMAGVSNSFSQFTGLLNKGYDATKEVYPNALVAVHFANPEKADNYRNWAASLKKNNAKYDVFGSSYYPYWHGTLENLGNILSEIAETYDKKTMVLETSYAFTEEDTDFYGNTVGTGSDVAKPYPFSIAGQANCFRDVVDTVVNHCTNGIGVCYWEGTWISVGTESWEENHEKWEKYGSGWAASYAAEYDPVDAGKWYGGCAVDNQAFFDAKGHALESLKVLNNVRFGNDAPLYVDGVEDARVSYYTYEDFTLPETVNVVYNTNERSPLPVEWEPFDIPAAKAAGNAKYDILGKAEGYDGEVHCYLQIMEKNFLDNYGFENGADYSPWRMTNLSETELSDDYKVLPTKENPQTGDWAFHFWAKNADVAKFEVEQDVVLESSGTYKFQASLLGGTDISPAAAENQVIYLYAKINGVEVGRQTMNFKGYASGYSDFVLTGIEYEAGQTLTVGFHMESHVETNPWGDVDDCMLNLVL